MSFPFAIQCADAKARADAKAALTLAAAGTNAASVAHILAAQANSVANAARDIAEGAVNGVGVVKTLVEDIDGTPPRVYNEDVFGDFKVVADGAKWNVSWSYANLGGHSKDYVYYSLDAGHSWKLAGYRYNDQSHKLQLPAFPVVDIRFAIAGFVMNDAAGVRVRVTDWAYTYGVLSDYITAFTAEPDWPLPDLNGTNLPGSSSADIKSLSLAWTAQDALAPAGLAGFACFTKADGAGWLLAGTFGPGERSAKMVSPSFSSTLEAYLVAIDAGGNPISSPSLPVLLTAIPYITAFTAERVDALNVLLAWTTDDAIAPSNLAGFYCYASGEGAGWLRTGTFDPDERGSTMGQLPPYTSVLDLYLMAHDAAGRQLSFLTPIAVVLGQSG